MNIKYFYLALISLLFFSLSSCSGLYSIGGYKVKSSSPKEDKSNYISKSTEEKVSLEMEKEVEQGILELATIDEGNSINKVKENSSTHLLASNSNDFIESPTVEIRSLKELKLEKAKIEKINSVYKEMSEEIDGFSVVFDDDDDDPTLAKKTRNSKLSFILGLTSLISLIVSAMSSLIVLIRGADSWYAFFGITSIIIMGLAIAAIVLGVLGTGGAAMTGIVMGSIVAAIALTFAVLVFTVF